MKKLMTLVFLVFASTGIFSQKYELVKKWETDSVWKVPESVLYDYKHHVLYVTNIDGKDPWVKDGVGSIGKLSTDGRVIAVEWVTGLN